MELLQKLRSESGKWGKEFLLRSATEEELRVFNYAYDKNKVYHIRQVGDIDYDNLGEPNDSIFEFLDALMAKEDMGMHPKDALHEVALAHGDLVKLIVKKDLDCGVAATTVNRACPGTIPQFKIQLAKEAPLSSVTFPCLAQIKYDGVRIIIDKREGQLPRFFTRNGKEVILPQIAEDITRLKPSPFILDTEVTLRDGKMEGRTTVSGMINSAMHGGTIDESLLVFNVFDALTIEEFDSAICLRPYRARFKHAMFLMENMLNDQIIPALTIPCDTVKHVQDVYDALIADGYEGLILKTDEHKYSFKRTKDWVKMKETKTVDLKCIDIIHGEGKYEGMVGALLCEGYVGAIDDKGFIQDYKVTVAVGSGLTDLQRDATSTCYIDKTIEVKYNTIIQDSKTGKHSLFLPRFVCVRFDK